eukprot:16191898-Heterocapsa_arctica.AAC.1
MATKSPNAVGTVSWRGSARLCRRAGCALSLAAQSRQNGLNGKCIMRCRVVNASVHNRSSRATFRARRPDGPPTCS